MWRGITISLLLHCLILYLVLQGSGESHKENEKQTIKVAFLEISEENTEKEVPPQETSAENIGEKLVDTPENASPSEVEEVATKEPPQPIEETIIISPHPSEIVVNTSTNIAQSIIAVAESPIISGGQANVAPFRLSPHYPRRSRSRGEEGTVIISVEIDETGHITKSQIIQSSGYLALDNEALKSAFGAQVDLSTLGNIRNFTFPVEFRLK